MKDTIQIIVGTIGILSALGAFIALLWRILRKIEKRFEHVEKTSELRKEESIVLIKATLAICDGLGQLGANGPVTKCKSDLQEYLIQRGE